MNTEILYIEVYDQLGNKVLVNIKNQTIRCISPYQHGIRIEYGAKDVDYYYGYSYDNVQKLLTPCGLLTEFIPPVREPL